MRGAPATIRPAEPTASVASPASAASAASAAAPVQSEAIVWIDHDQALVVASEPDGRATAKVLERQPAETEASFDERALGDVIGHERVVVSGPAGARTNLERAYVSITHRPDRLLDVAPTTVEPSLPTRRG